MENARQINFFIIFIVKVDFAIFLGGGSFLTRGNGLSILKLITYHNIKRHWI